MDNNRFNNQVNMDESPFTAYEIEMILKGEKPKPQFRGDQGFTVEEILDDK